MLERFDVLVPVRCCVGADALMCWSRRVVVLVTVRCGVGALWCWCVLVLAVRYFYYLLKEVSSARLRESDLNPISPKTQATQYQLTDRQKEDKGKNNRRV